MTEYLPDRYRGRDDSEELEERYEKMMFEPGEAVGVVGAQSIAEPATQMTMETYHKAGAARVSITLGLPRLIEILDARKNPKTPIMNVYLDEDKRTEEGAREVAAEIQEVKFEDIVSEDSFNIARLELDFTIDENVLEEFRIEKDDIVEKLKEKTSGAVVERDGDTITAYPQEEDYDLTDLQELKKKAMGIRMKGIKGIDHVVILEENGEWRVQTAGVNLRKVMKIDGVDATRTTTNDFFETKKVLGVEATREMILHELQNTLDEQGMNVDVRWLLMIADTMTKRGEIQGTTRYGLVGAKHSVLARSAFEETKSHLTDAALKGERDPLRSVVENIIVGQQVPVGTGRVSLRAEPGKAEPVEEPSIPIDIDEEVDYERLVEETVAEIKEAVEGGRAEALHVLEAEKEGDNRNTLIEWLERRVPLEDRLDYDELLEDTVSDIKETVREPVVDPLEVLKREMAGKNRGTLVEWLVRRAADSIDEEDYEDFVGGTVGDVKERIESGEVDPVEALVVEKDSKDRGTLVEWLERFIERRAEEEE